MLEVSGVSRSYGSFLAVEDVSFSIRQGEIVGLLGHNGAGKTTIMKMLSGYMEPDAGRITVDGHDLATDAKQAQRNLGYLPENLPVYPEMTVAEYLDYVGHLKGLDETSRIEEMRRCIAISDLMDRHGQRIGTLSRGYRQRVGVAQALMGSPRLIILDEPTNGLDPAQTEQMREAIRQVASQATVILSTHIMQEVEAVCDRVLMIHQGRLAVNERLDSLTGSNALIVETDAKPDTLHAALAGIAGAGEIENIAADGGDPDHPGRGVYRLRFESEKRARSVGAEISAAIVSAGCALHAMYPERRDLETLFAELTSTTQGVCIGEVRHAA